MPSGVPCRSGTVGLCELAAVCLIHIERLGWRCECRLGAWTPLQRDAGKWRMEEVVRESWERESNIRVGPHTAPRPDVVMPPVEVTVLSRFQGT